MSQFDKVAKGLVEEYKMSLKTAKEIIVSALDGITKIAEETRVRIGNHTFEPKIVPAREARDGRNPATGESLRIAAKPAYKKINYKFHGTLKPLVPPKKSKKK